MRITPSCDAPARGERPPQEQPEGHRGQPDDRRRRGATAPPAHPQAPLCAAQRGARGRDARSGHRHRGGDRPAIGNVWLIVLSGGGFAEALTQPAAAPFLTGTLLGASTLLPDWSSQAAAAFAAEAAVAEPPPAGATPPLLHAIVQPPCPEG